MLVADTALPIRVRNVVQEARVQRGAWGVSAQQSWRVWKVVGEEVLDVVLELLAVRHTTAGCHLKQAFVLHYCCGIDTGQFFYQMYLFILILQLLNIFNI